MTDLVTRFHRGDRFLMEGALGERLKREYGLTPDPNVALAIHSTTPNGQQGLQTIWLEYASIAENCGLPFLATTPTRRANRSRVDAAGMDEQLLRENVRFLRRVLHAHPGAAFLGGMIGCHGDAYTGEGALSQGDAHSFHRWQTEIFGEEQVDFLYGALLPTLPEALGLAKPCKKPVCRLS